MYMYINALSHPLFVDTELHKCSQLIERLTFMTSRRAFLHDGRLCYWLGTGTGSWELDEPRGVGSNAERVLKAA